MPRDGSGVASAPPGTVATPNTTILSSAHNNLRNDIYSILNTAWPVALGGTGGTSPETSRAALGLAPLYAAFSGSTASVGASFAFAEGTDNGVNKISLKAPDSLTADRTILLPDRSGTLAMVGDATVPRGYLYGLTLTNNATDAANDIDIAVGEASSDAATPVLIALETALTKRLDAAWAVGTNQGMLDTGSATNATYYIWLIRRSDTGIEDVLASLSATAPTMPANYDQKRRIGFFVRASGANLKPYLVTDPLYFETAEQVITAAGALSLANPLNTMPKNITVILVCKTAELGFAVGDETEVPTGAYAEWNPAQNSVGMQVVATASAVNCRYGAWVSVFAVLNFSSGSSTGITIGNWRMKLRLEA